VKGKKAGGGGGGGGGATSDDGGSWDASPYSTLTHSTSGGGTADSNKYRANARAKLPSIFNPFVKVTTPSCQ